MSARKRNHNESFKAYRKRLQNEQVEASSEPNETMFWPSTQLGTLCYSSKKRELLHLRHPDNATPRIAQ